MASYIQTLKRKLVGAIGHDVSSATTVTTARSDAETAMDQLEAKVFTVRVADTTNATTPTTRLQLTEMPDGTGWVVLPFNAKLERADLTLSDGALAASLTDYVNFQLLYVPPAGTAAYAIATFSNTTTAMTALIRQQMVNVATAAVLSAGATIGAYSTKTGAGNTNGVGCITFCVNRRDDS
jgi:hypothetical protein